MTTSTRSLGLTFEVTRIDTIATPYSSSTGTANRSPKLLTRQFRNEFDELGDIISLPRLRGEKNWEYRRRLWDTFANIANSSYRGLINGVTRGVGLSLYTALQINPKTNGDEFIAPDPYIKIEGPFIYLYSDYANNELDHKIDRYEPGGNYEHLGRLVDFINTTIYFEAHIEPEISEYTRSMVLLNQTNRLSILGEYTTASTKFQLKHNHIVENTLWFENKNFFRTEVSTEAEVGSPGSYYVNYVDGIITCAYVPPSTIVRYYYIPHPFKIKASPIILHNINFDSFKEKMFEQILQDDKTYANGLPTKLGADIVNELLSVYPMYYGV